MVARRLRCEVGATTFSKARSPTEGKAAGWEVKAQADATRAARQKNLMIYLVWRGVCLLCAYCEVSTMREKEEEPENLSKDAVRDEVVVENSRLIVTRQFNLQRNFAVDDWLEHRRGQSEDAKPWFLRRLVPSCVCP